MGRRLADAKRAIDALFSDTAVDAEETLADLEELQSEIGFKIDAVKMDLQAEPQ